MSVATDTIQRGIDNLRANGFDTDSLVDKSCLNVLIEMKHMLERTEREALSAEPGKAKMIQALTNRINAAGEVMMYEEFVGNDQVLLKFKPKGQPINAIEMDSGAKPLTCAEAWRRHENSLRGPERVGIALEDSKPDPDNLGKHLVTMVLWPGMQPCCTPAAEKSASDPAAAISPRILAAVKASQLHLLEHLRKKCPDCCLGLTGWLPCEKHQ